MCFRCCRPCAQMGLGNEGSSWCHIPQHRQSIRQQAGVISFWHGSPSSQDRCSSGWPERLANHSTAPQGPNTVQQASCHACIRSLIVAAGLGSLVELGIMPQQECRVKAGHMYRLSEHQHEGSLFTMTFVESMLAGICITDAVHFTGSRLLKVIVFGSQSDRPLI